MNTVVSTPTAVPSFVLTFIIVLIVAFAVAIAMGVVSALLYKRAFNKLAEKSGVHSFDTTGLLILIGVFIPIVSWVGWIFAASGFNALKPKPYSPMPTAPTITSQIKFCRNCGIANNVNAAYCKNCGKQLP
jgi:ribosomal protein L40E